MKYHLGIDTMDGGEHPSLQYDSLGEAQEAVKKALNNGYIRMDGDITVMTGPGTVYKVVSDAHLHADEGFNPFKDNPYVVVVQMGPVQLTPFGYRLKSEAADAVSEVIATGIFTHCGRPDHEYTFIHARHRGTTFIEMETGAFLAMQRQRLAQQMQDQQQGPKIHIPD